MSTTLISPATPPLKVGALAKATGLSVRTLHHYDDIGLLVPSVRTPAGHRLYTAEDVQRLQQIHSLRAVGFPLEEIRQLLQSSAISAQHVIQLHLQRLREHIEAQQQLARRLQQVARHLETANEPPVAELLRIIEGTRIMEKYFTTEQLAEMETRRTTIGEARIKEVEQEWAEIIPAVRAHMARGTGPDDAELQQLARRWKTLVDEFTGGNREIAANVRRMYDSEHATINAANPNTPDPSMFAYMGAVFAKLGGGPG